MSSKFGFYKNRGGHCVVDHT